MTPSAPSSSKRAQADAKLAALERELGAELSRVAPSTVDQWAAGVRDQFAMFDAELSTPGRARAAFAGGYIVVSAMMHRGPDDKHALITVCNVLRWLYGRGEQEDDAWLSLQTML